MPAQNTLRQIKLIFYKLSRSYGQAITLYKPTGIVTDYKLGTNIATFSSLDISHVIVLPETLKREFLNLSGGSFQYGGYFDVGSRIFIIEAKHLNGYIPDNNYYLVDGLRDRLNLRERTTAMFEFQQKYMPKGVGYEKYGKDSDIEHIQEKQEMENRRFSIIPLGGRQPKNDRIRKLIPVFEQGRFYIPDNLAFNDYQGLRHDFTSEFINEEYVTFPVAKHDDILDCAARIFDVGAVFPSAINTQEIIPGAGSSLSSGWSR